VGSTPIARFIYSVMRIISVDPGSPLYGLIRPGYKLVRINGEKVHDNLDYRYKIAEEAVALEFEDTRGERFGFKVRFETTGDLGLTFEQDKILTCHNRCVFCFIHQQPKGMRRPLYVRDDDYRLSFTHGNFISLSNLDEEDITRIIEQKLSPLYISVHATDDSLRRALFRNDKLPPILPLLQQMIDGGINFHTQVVVCPGINDGDALEKTINDLFDLYPGVATVGVVPVGLTKYRKRLPQLKSFDSEMAAANLEYLHRRQKEFKKKSSTRFVYAADEFYILAGRDFPSLSAYEEMSQFENGIGMMRLLLSDFSRRRRFLKVKSHRSRIAQLTGVSAFGPIRKNIVMPLRKEGMKLDLYQVENHFWGEKVTVSGLLTGRDILAKIKSLPKEYDFILLPPNCLNDDRLFLDDLGLDDLQKKVASEIKVGYYSMIDTLNEVTG
jgi:putative radical SAM enzyme (TIGR03279 family)